MPWTTILNFTEFILVIIIKKNAVIWLLNIAKIICAKYVAKIFRIKNLVLCTITLNNFTGINLNSYILMKKERILIDSAHCVYIAES